MYILVGQKWCIFIFYPINYFTMRKHRFKINVVSCTLAIGVVDVHVCMVTVKHSQSPVSKSVGIEISSDS